MLIPGKDDDAEALQDADASLRWLSRLFSRSLAELVLRPEECVLRLDWGETQIALSRQKRQKRLDRILNVDVSPTLRRVLHIEWAMRLDAAVTGQTAHYHIQSAIMARQDARRHRRAGEARKTITVKSIVVVLTGRRTPWPEIGELRTSDSTHRFVGVEFVIEPVYQRTVRELEEKGMLFWLAFVPLAKDVDEEGVRRIAKRLCSEANEEEYDAIVAVMWSMARIRKKDWPELPDMIRSAFKKEGDMRHPFFEIGEERGLKRGLERGREEGREEGREALMRFQFERRLGRRLRSAERRRLSDLLLREGVEKVGVAVLELSPEELASFIKPNDLRSRKPKRAMVNQGEPRQL